MSETYVTYKVWGWCKAPINLEYSGHLIGQIVRESTIDRDALLALADDIDKQTDGSMFDIWLEDGHYIARRIREALGVKDGN